MDGLYEGLTWNAAGFAVGEGRRAARARQWLIVVVATLEELMLVLSLSR